ncbi:hypothetical protein AVEN_201564-1, partial [Araneus ventricosus]
SGKDCELRADVHRFETNRHESSGVYDARESIDTRSDYFPEPVLRNRCDKALPRRGYLLSRFEIDLVQTILQRSLVVYEDGWILHVPSASKTDRSCRGACARRHQQLHAGFPLTL